MHRKYFPAKNRGLPVITKRILKRFANYVPSATSCLTCLCALPPSPLTYLRPLCILIFTRLN